MSHHSHDHQKLVHAAEAIKSAQLRLMDLVRAVYPLDAIVAVNMGRHVVRVKIAGYGASYAISAGDLWGDNIASGRRRRFHFSQIIPDA